MLPDPATVPAGMSYEIKDSSGTAGGGTTKIIVQAPGWVTIDGSADDDEITKAWGSKTYVTTGTGYVVRGDQRAISAISSGGGSLLVDFGGLDGAPLPTGWSSTTVGTGIDWLISTDTFHSDGSNHQSAGSDYDPDEDSTTMGAASVASPALSTLFYNPGTVTAGKIIKFRWLRDTYDADQQYGNGDGVYSFLRFYVNGTNIATHSSRGNWQTFSYIVPTTGVYVLSWEWWRRAEYKDLSRMNGCFIDEFELLDPPSPSVAYNFDGVEEAALPTGWTAARTGVWPAEASGWLQEGVYYPALASTSSLGDHYDGSHSGQPKLPYETSTLTYNAGTLTAGTIVSFKWMYDLYYAGSFSGADNNYKFVVNGVAQATFDRLDNGNWASVSYTVPTTGTYILDWKWGPLTYLSAHTHASRLNGVFMDEFTIT